MTEQGKLKKIGDIDRQLADIELKFGRLLIQANRLKARREELLKKETKETKVPTVAERTAQANQDRQREFELLQTYVDEGNLDAELLKKALSSKPIGPTVLDKKLQTPSQTNSEDRPQ